MTTATLKAAYAVTELADMSGLSRHQVARMLSRRAVRMVQLEPGGKRWVPLTSFRDALPEVWDAIVLRAELDPDAPVLCQLCQSQVA